MTPREIDVAIARDVFKFDVRERGGWWHINTGGKGAYFEEGIPEYHFSFGFAWQIARHLKKEGFTVAIAYGPDGATASIMRDNKIVGFVSGDEPARVLCLAALKAYGVEIE